MESHRLGGTLYELHILKSQIQVTYNSDSLFKILCVVKEFSIQKNLKYHSNNCLWDGWVFSWRDWKTVILIVLCIDCAGFFGFFSQGFRGSGKGAVLESLVWHTKSKMRVISLSFVFRDVKANPGDVSWVRWSQLFQIKGPLLNVQKLVNICRDGH